MNMKHMQTHIGIFNLCIYFYMIYVYSYIYIYIYMYIYNIVNIHIVNHVFTIFMDYFIIIRGISRLSSVF